MSELDSGLKIQEFQEEWQRHAQHSEEVRIALETQKELRKWKDDELAKELLLKPKSKKPVCTSQQKISKSLFKQAKQFAGVSTSLTDKQNEVRKLSPLCNVFVSEVNAVKSVSIELSIDEMPLSAISEKSAYKLGDSIECSMNPVDSCLENKSKDFKDDVREHVNKFGQTKANCLGELLQSQRQFVDQLEALNKFYRVSLVEYKNAVNLKGKKKGKNFMAKLCAPTEPAITQYHYNVMEKHTPELLKLNQAFLRELEQVEIKNISELFLKNFDLTMGLPKENLCRQYIDFINHSEAVIEFLQEFQKVPYKESKFALLCEVCAINPIFVIFKCLGIYE